MNRRTVLVGSLRFLHVSLRILYVTWLSIQAVYPYSCVFIQGGYLYSTRGGGSPDHYYYSYTPYT